MRMSVIAGVVSTFALVSCSFAQDGPDAQALYQQHCAQCHGANLEGGNAQSMINGVWMYGADSGYIARNIKHGLTHLGMPAYGEVLSNQEIRALVDFILAAEEEAGAVRPPAPEKIQTLEYEAKVEVWLDDLDTPWGIAFPDSNTALVTEKNGNLFVIEEGVQRAEPVAGTPEVLNEGQGGLMDVAVDPAYGENGWIYLAFSHPIAVEGQEQPAAMTKLVRGRIDGNAWADEETLFEAPHDTYLRTRHHYGCRIVFDDAGLLYFSIGDRGFQNNAQELNTPNGKIHRINTDGSIPSGNPFVNNANALPSIYTYGNRNPQGLAFHPEDGTLWESEHGPMGGDEINVLRAGQNYGWPEITYGKNYNGTIISEFTRKEGMEQPALYFRPSIAVCGIAFYEGEEFPKWRNKLLVSALRYEDVRLLTVENDRVMHDEVIFKGAGRVRHVAVDSQGAVYVVLNKPGQILKLTAIGELTGQ
jgi:aldose sugar dehydrogenase